MRLFVRCYGGDDAACMLVLVEALLIQFDEYCSTVILDGMMALSFRDFTIWNCEEVLDTV